MCSKLIIYFLICILASTSGGVVNAAAGGRWHLLQPSIGITAMHMQLLHNDRVVIFDRTDFGRSNISLPDGKCRNDPREIAVKNDCSAHSVEYDVATNKFRPLTVLTDVWCSSGAVMADGHLVQTGGFNDGDRVVRTFQPCAGNCDWQEIQLGLAVRRWYPSNHILPDGRQIIIGGRGQYNYEFYPKTAATSQAFSLPFLAQTHDRIIENNLYPFVHLNVDGHLFIFANNRAILFDYKKNTVVRTYPKIPGGDPRSYPSTGSSVLLPLKTIAGNANEAEVLICGGAPIGGFVAAANGNFVKALDTCARIRITDPSPNWVMEKMPGARVMCDMILLPNGDVLIINGAATGTAGWQNGRNPNFHPFSYKPNKPNGERFAVMAPATIPRMYHSAAILLRDGRVLVGGSNPNKGYNFAGVVFPTELSLEAFSPTYLEPEHANFRPKIVLPAFQSILGYGKVINIRFSIKGQVIDRAVTVTVVAPSFTTHSFGMNQRLLDLGGGKLTPVGLGTYQVQVTAPVNPILAPAGYYLLFVVYQDVPSEGIWVKIQ